MKRLTIFHLISRSIMCRAFRTCIIVLCVAIVVGSLFSTALLVRSVNRGLEVGFQRFGADLMVVPRGTEASVGENILMGVPVKMYMDRSIEDEVAETKGVGTVSSQLFIVSLTGASCCSTGNYQLVAYDPASDFTITPWLSESLDRPLGLNELVGGANTIYPVGTPLIFYGQDLKIAAKLEASGLGLDNSGFITFETAYHMIDESYFKAEQPVEMPYDKLTGQYPISAVLVKIKSDTTKADVAYLIQRHIQNVDVIVASELTNTVRKQVSGLSSGLYVFSALMLGMSLLFIGMIFSMATNERRREIGLSRSMGASRFFIFKLIVSEAVFLTLSSGIAGMIGGAITVYSFKSLVRTTLNVPLLWPNLLGFLTLGGIYICLSVFIGVAASFYPAVLSSRIEPYDAIRKGEF